MNVKFETINGQLCRMVEPTALTEKSLTHYTPCAIRPIKDNTQIGKLNKRTIYSGLSNCDGVYILNERQIGTGSYKNMIYAPWGSAHAFEQFEIIGYPVVDGSAEWALHNALAGRIVTMEECAIYKIQDGKLWECFPNDSNEWRVVADDGIRYWLKYIHDETGWQIYEPEPEPKESPIDPIERPLRNLILEAKEKGVNIRTWYQDLIFTPESLTSYLSNGRFRWWNIGNWELTKREANMTMPEPQPTKEPIADCNNCKHVCTKSNIDYCHMYEPKPTYKVGDWVRTEDGDGEFMSYAKGHVYDNAVFFSVDYVTYDAFIRLTTGKCEVYPVSSLIKLSPFEVEVDFGFAKGRILSRTSGDVKVLNNKSVVIATIIVSEITNPTTRSLVESILKAQEEK